MPPRKIFEDIFRLEEINKGSKGKQIFDKVTRIEASSEQFDMKLSLDVNTDIYPMKEGENFTVVLTDTLSLDGVPDDGFYDQSNEKTLMNQYDYVMYGKLYKYEDLKDAKVQIFVSFGGLLMRLVGDGVHLQDFKPDQRLYILIRKV